MNDLLRIIVSASMLVGVAGHGCGSEEESPTCKTLRADLKAQLAVADAQLAALRAETKAAIATPLVRGDAGCDVAGLNPRQHWHVYPKTVDTQKEPGALAHLRSLQLAAEDCNILPPGEQAARLKELQDVVAGMADKHAIVFIEGQRIKPELLDGKTYNPGKLDGQVLLWSYKDQRVVCAAQASATSGAKLHTLTGGAGSASRALNSQLTFLTVKDGVEKLKKVAAP